MKEMMITLIIVSLSLNCTDGRLTDSGEIPAKGTDTFSHLGITRQKDSLIAALGEMKAEKLDCSAETYWKVIQQGEKMIPVLLECLTDTHPTTIYNNCKKGNLNVGEVCYFALEELADFPAFMVTQTQYDLIENDCWNFYTYLFNDKNKSEYQGKAKNFYNAYRKTNYHFKKYTVEELTACRKLYKIEGKLQWKEG